MGGGGRRGCGSAVTLPAAATAVGRSCERGAAFMERPHHERQANTAATGTSDNPARPPLLAVQRSNDTPWPPDHRATRFKRRKPTQSCGAAGSQLSWWREARCCGVVGDADRPGCDATRGGSLGATGTRPAACHGASERAASRGCTGALWPLVGVARRGARRTLPGELGRCHWTPGGRAHGAARRGSGIMPDRDDRAPGHAERVGATGIDFEIFSSCLC